MYNRDKITGHTQVPFSILCKFKNLFYKLFCCTKFVRFLVLKLINLIFLCWHKLKKLTVPLMNCNP